MVEIYRSWAGPCSPMLNILTKFKVELQVKYIGENFHERLQFALACTDDVTVRKWNFILSIYTSLLVLVLARI